MTIADPSVALSRRKYALIFSADVPMKFVPIIRGVSGAANHMSSGQDEHG